MKAVIYARYSSDNQREESIEGQIRECTDYANRNDITILSTYIDRAFSARTADRPDFQRMICDSDKKLFDVVLVYKLDRFSRDRYDSAHYKRILKKNGVRVVSVKENISDRPEGILMESMLEGYAEYYSAELSEKIRRGQKENALKGKNNGGGIPLGYQLDKATQKLVIGPETASIVLETFTRYADGETIREIIDDFNNRGLKTSKGKAFTHSSFNTMLSNRKYIGEYSYQDVIIPDGVPAIVSADLFERVQQRREKNKRAPAMSKAHEDFILTTKLFCGKCGRMMVGESGTSRTGAKHYYYKCGGVKRHKDCDKKAVKKHWIEDLVVAEAMRMVKDDAVVDAIVSMLMDLQGRENTNLPLYQRQLRDTDTKIANLLKAITEGVFTKSTKALLEELEAAKEELENRITLEKLEKPQMSEEFMRFWLHGFRKLDMARTEHRQMLIDVFINAIFLYDNKMLLTFNYKDGSKTVTFADVKETAEKAAFGSDLEQVAPPKKEREFFVHALFYFWIFVFGFLFSNFNQSFQRYLQGVGDFQQNGHGGCGVGGFYPLNLLAAVTCHFSQLLLRQALLFAVAHDVEANLNVRFVMFIVQRSTSLF